MILPLRSFTGVMIVVFAVSQKLGEPVAPVQLAAKDLRLNNTIQIGMPKLGGIRRPPYPTGPKTLVVAIDAREVIACHLALGWRLPERIVDLLIEIKNLDNGKVGQSVGGALLRYRLSLTGALGVAKSHEQLRQKIGAIERLFNAMLQTLDLPRALLRGRYLAAVARMEIAGVPVDNVAIKNLAKIWPSARAHIIELIDAPFGAYRGARFDPAAFAALINDRGIDWPRKLDRSLWLDDQTFREMARLHLELQPLKDLRRGLAEFDPRQLAVGRDGRNRVPLRPFASRTGRNQPSAKMSVFGSVAWARNLLFPEPGTGLALIDWAQQEFGIAAALSEDAAMQGSYRSGDPYMALASSAGALPPNAPPGHHEQVRNRFKACALGVQYGMGATTLARRLGLSEWAGQSLLDHHRKSFPDFWRWSNSIEQHALLNRKLKSVFGWQVSVGADTNPRFLRNYPMQANGAEMLRLACCLTTEAGIRVCAPLHDALLIEAPLKELDGAVLYVQRLMAEASSVVLGGFELRTEVRTVRWPDRWSEPKGQAIWSAVETILGLGTSPARQRDSSCSPVHPRPISLYVSKEDPSDASD